MHQVAINYDVLGFCQLFKNDFGSDIHCYCGSLEVQRLLLPEMMSAGLDDGFPRFPITLPYLH